MFDSLNYLRETLVRLTAEALLRNGRHMDLLHDHLTRARASGAVFARTVARPPWGLRLGGSIQLAVHAVVQGHGWLWFDDAGQSPVRLSPGDVTLVRGGPDHFIGHEPGAECREPEDFRAQHGADRFSDDPQATVFLCGAYMFSGDVGSGLLKTLPQVMSFSPAIGNPLREVVSLLSHELMSSEPGQNTVLDRLLDILLVLAIRTSFRQSTMTPRWYQASADPRLKAALEAMHQTAAHPWSVPELARVSGLSRAAFARTFGEALGQTPMQYLTDWRMTLARDHLRNGEMGLAEIASLIGYGSPYAFAAAFRRHHGCAPGAWRQNAARTNGMAGDGIHLSQPASP
jgi:AraC-like DNA-binding protein